MNEINSSKTFKTTIRDLTSDGYGVGLMPDGAVAMIRGALPGDVIIAELEQGNTKRRNLARIVKREESSPDRCVHPCVHHSQGCPGSLLGIMKYEAGLAWKRNYLVQQLQRIGDLKNAPVEKVVESPQKWRYRDRIELHLWRDSRRWRFGFLNGSKRKLIPIVTCNLASEAVEQMVVEMDNSHKAIRDVSEPRSARILLRDNGEGGVIAVVFFPVKKLKNSALDIFRSWLNFLPLAGWQVRISASEKSRFFASSLTDESNYPRVVYPIGDQNIYLPPNTFIQTNRSVRELLVEEILSKVPDNARLLDLYGGFGAFGLAHALRGGEAVVVDSAPDGLKTGEKFCQENSLNARFVKMDLNKPDDLEMYLETADAVILDPPRAGLSDEVVQKINKHGAKKLMYVSCHPAALARDLAKLTKYKVVQIQPFDMFPQTPDLETLAILKRI